MARPVLRTAICDQLGIEYPIFQAGMGSRGAATPPKLAAAVSEAGGLGVLGGSALSAEEIRQRIRTVRSLTDKPFGVDLLLPASLAQAETARSAVRAQIAKDFPKYAAFERELRQRYGLDPDVVLQDEVVISPKLVQAQAQVCLDEKVPVFIAGLGDPTWFVPKAKAQGMCVMGLVGTVRHAERQVKAGCDVIIAQGTEAGGHTGYVANFPLIPDVVDNVAPTPVLAAGGISDGRGVAAALALGALGAWLGTAFLVADECDIPAVKKDQIVSGRAQDFSTSRTYTGKNQRGFRHEIHQAWAESGLDPLPMPFQTVLMEDFMEAATVAGRLDLESNPAGQGAGLIKARAPARKIVEDIVQGTVEALAALSGRVRVAG